MTLNSFNESDGKIILNFSEDNLEVRGDFYPSRFDGKPINQNYIRRLLDEYKIIYGINRMEISRAFRKCVNDHDIVMDVLIARGISPEEEIPEHFKLNPYLGRSGRKSNEKGRIDHRERSPFIIVKKGQALAVHKKRIPGKDGINVLGEQVKFDTKKQANISGGENTLMKEKYLISAIHGQLIQSKGVLSVRESLIVKGSVGYKTGNIIFPGDIMIEGPVSDGFKIHSGGSINIKQTFDITDVSTKGDLNVAGGIIGRGKAMVKVGGKTRAKFIENCLVACRDRVMVDLEIINSRIYTMEFLEMGEKGRIIGGEIYAIKGLSCGGLGKITGKAAKIHCGVDFTKEQEREKNNNTLRMLSVKIKRVKTAMENVNDEMKEKMQKTLTDLEEERDRTQEKISILLENMNNYEDAYIEVKGEIVPGTLIEICHTALFVTESLKKVRIKLDRDINKLITENL